MKSIIACILVFSALNYVISQYTSCLQMLSNATDRLLYCTFVNNNSAVRCDIMYTGDSTYSYDMDAYSYLNYDDELEEYYLHYKFIFKIIESINTSVFCLGLQSSVFEKVSDITSYNAEIRDNTTLYHFKDIKSLFVKCKFNDSIPVAFMELDTDCAQLNGSCNTILKMNVLNVITSPPSDMGAFPLFDWTVLYRDEPNAYGSHSIEFSLDFYSNYPWVYPDSLLSIIYQYPITCLSVTGTKLKSIVISILDEDNYHPGLLYLDLSNNKINAVHGSMSSAPILEVLILADNVLQTVPGEIANLTMLKHLDLSLNPITDFESFYILKQLSNLKLLNIAFIRMVNISILEALFSKCEGEFQLEILNLSYCGIQFLNDYDFWCQKNLKLLDLSHNNLKEIPLHIVLYQKYLIVLNFSNNLIDQEHYFILGNNATILDMSKNNLSNINYIAALGYVDYLDLSGNNILSWSNDKLFDNVSNLNLSRNRITSASKEMIQSFMTLNSIDLGGNSFDCSNCLLPDFQNWLKANKQNIYNFGSVKQLICTLPSSEYGKHIVDINFDLSLCITDYLMIVGVPMIVFVVGTLITTTLCYIWRFEIAYILHLLKIKKRITSKDSPGKFKYDAFVCYSGHDRDWVLGELLPTLESEPDKYRLCLHDRDFVLGSYIAENIISSLDTSRRTVVILTDNFVKSHWCQWELEMANHKLFEDGREFLILIELERLDRSSLPRHLKYLMDTRTYLEWPENNDNIERIWRRLKDSLGPSICNRHSNPNNEEEGEEIQLE